MAAFTSISTGSERILKSIVVILIVLFSKNVGADASSWLMRIDSAADEVSFSGTFVHIYDGKVDAMKVARRVIKKGIIQEHLRSLNGPPTEVIRDMDGVWYYAPDQGVVQDYQHTYQRGFPAILAGDFQNLELHYRFVEGADIRIANRPAHQIDIIPNDAYRYGYHLWADHATGLLLRSDLIDQQGEIIEQYLFIDVEIGKDITDEQLAAVSNKDKLQLFGDNTPATTAVEYSDWKLTQIPDGYTLSKHIRRISMDDRWFEHMVYTDGLSSVSVFIKEIQEGESETSGLSRMGGVHAYRKRLRDCRITVMGEVPAKTVEHLAQGLKYIKE